MTAPVNKVTYREIVVALIKTILPMGLAGLLYKPIRSQLVHDQFMTAIADVAFFFLIFYIARWVWAIFLNACGMKRRAVAVVS